MQLTPDESESAVRDFFNTNVPLATYLRQLRNANTDGERVDAIGNLLWGRFYHWDEGDQQHCQEHQRTWRIPVGLRLEVVSEREVRSAQAQLLNGTLTTERKQTIDAVLSYFCNNVTPNCWDRT